ncbi:DUF927 domain-containing protein [Gilvimarinus polysaccharolyticus]|uniref:DUF927 domain-containing protein n=1 Tax=Gilvimarinus polysaccharolyticus TaxID=863921 RepID=UPI000673ADAD|nr:DUF927 domain-containing protein [Gilvimarinus polysaccharolyticus]
MGNKLNFKAVADAALNCAEAVCSHWAPDGKKQGHEWVARNPVRADNSARSFSINVNTGVWCDFATDDKGGDLIALVAYLERLEQGEACKRLAAFLGMDASDTTAPPPVKSKPKKPAFEPVYPPPASAAKSCPKKHYQLGDASHYWDYLSVAGALLMRVARFDRTGTNGERKKEYRPTNYGIKNGYTKWHWLQLPDNRPLYGLEKFAQFDTALPVVVVEGEKAADAARLLFPERLCITWSGGSKAISKTDFKPLAGRVVWYWPDNDDAGAASIGTLQAALNAVGVAGFEVIDLASFGGDWPDKADAADALELGFTPEQLNTLIADNKLLVTSEGKAASATPTAPKSHNKADSEGPDSAAPFGYTVDDGGVYFYDAKAEKKRRICSRLDVLALSRDGLGSGRNWGKLVRFCDYDGVEKLWNIPARLFAAEGGSEVVRGLLDRGLDIDSHREAKRKVLEYLQGGDIKSRVSLAYKMGWHRGSFVLPARTVGDSKEPVMYYSEGEPLCKLSEGGTLEQWRDNVAKYCAGNPLAVFAVSAAFSSPLVELLGYEIMGFHFHGPSSWGKSTLLNVASSIYGKPDDYKKTWRATDNALEGLAAAHSDLLLALDEINQVDPRIVGEVVYMLGNGEGKYRANDRGQAGGNQHRWRFTFLSNGEKTLEQYLTESGKSVTGGQEMRFLGIKASFHQNTSDSNRYGVFNTAHDFDGGAALSEYLREAMAKYYGTAFPAYLEALLSAVEGDKRAAFCERLVAKVSRFKQGHLTAKAGGQVTRAATKFALVGVAGELATHFGVTGWQKGEALRAADACFTSWIETRGGEGNLEDKQMLEHVRETLSKYGESRFKRWDSPTDESKRIIDSHVPTTAEMWGYRREEIDTDPLEGDTADVVFYIYPEHFRRSVCKGWDHKRIARLLRDRGALILSDTAVKKGEFSVPSPLPNSGKKRVRVYKIRNSMLMCDDESEASPEEPAQDVSASF